MKKLLASVSLLAMCHAAVAQVAYTVPSTGVAPPATPAGQQQMITGTPWVNGRGAIQGPNWRDNYQIVHDILNGMGTWSPSGVYTPSIGGLPPAASATTDATQAANDAYTAPFAGSSIAALSKKLFDVVSATDFGAKCDAVYNATTGAWTGTDDTAALQRMANRGGDMYLPHNCRQTAPIGFNVPGSLYARKNSGNGLVVDFPVGNALNLATSKVSVMGVTFEHNQQHTSGADIFFAPTGGGTQGDFNDNVFDDPFIAIQVGGFASVVHIMHDMLKYTHYLTAPGARGVMIFTAGAVDVNIDWLDTLGGAVGGVQTNPDVGIYAAGNIGDLAINNSGLPLFKKALYAEAGPGYSIVSLRAFKTYFDSATDTGVDLFANGGVIGKADFVQTWTSSATNDGFRARTGALAAGAADENGTVCGPAGGCQGQVNGLDLVGHQALGNGLNGLDFADYYVSNVHVNGGAFGGNGNCGVRRSGSVNFSLINATVGGFGPGVGGNKYGLCTDAPVYSNGILIVSGLSNSIVANNHLEGNTSGNNINTSPSASEIFSDNVGYNDPCIPFTPTPTPFSGSITITSTSGACYRIKGKRVTGTFDFTIASATNATGGVTMPAPLTASNVTGAGGGGGGYASNAAVLGVTIQPNNPSKLVAYGGALTAGVEWTGAFSYEIP